MEKFALPKKNILFVITGLAMMIFGYVLMIGGGSDDPKVFNPEIFSVRRIVIAPIVILLGIVIEIIGIMYKPKHKKS